MTFERSRAWLSVKSASRTSTISSAPDDSPARIMFTYSVAKTLGCAAERVGERGALVHPLLHVAETTRFMLLVVDLLDERAERLDERDAGVDQHRQLPGRDGEVVGA